MSSKSRLHESTFGSFPACRTQPFHDNITLKLLILFKNLNSINTLIQSYIPQLDGQGGYLCLLSADNIVCCYFISSIYMFEIKQSVSHKCRETHSPSGNSKEETHHLMISRGLCISVLLIYIYIYIEKSAFQSHLNCVI